MKKLRSTCLGILSFLVSNYSFSAKVITFKSVQTTPIPSESLKYCSLSFFEHLLKGVKKPRDFMDSNSSPNLTVVAMSEGSTKGISLRPEVNHGFISSIFTAYNRHLPLVIRPDDVWLSIASAFALYLKTHSEEMRKEFVTFEGKKNIVIKRDIPKEKLTEGDWIGAVEEFASIADQSIDTKLKGWIEPNFTTTTELDVLSARVSMLSGLQNYFEYTMICMCGLPQVTLEGELRDWISLRAKAERLSWFGGDLEKWSKILLPVIDKIIQSFEGSIDEDFWQRIATHKTLGSGSEKELRGWFLVFAPFNAEGTYHLNTPEEIAKTNIYGHVDDISIVESASRFPFKLISYEATYEMEFYAGLSMPVYNESTFEVKTQVAWAVMEHNKHTNPMPSNSSSILKTVPPEQSDELVDDDAEGSIDEEERQSFRKYIASRFRRLLGF